MMKCEKFFKKMGNYCDESFSYYSTRDLKNFDGQFQDFFTLYRSLFESKLVIISLTRINNSLDELPPEEYIEKIYGERYFYITETYNNFINCLAEFRNKLYALKDKSQSANGPLSRMNFYQMVEQDFLRICTDLSNNSEVKSLITIRDDNHHFMRNIYGDNTFLESLELLKDQADSQSSKSDEVIREFRDKKSKEFRQIISICEDSLDRLCKLLDLYMDEIISQPVKITKEYNNKIKDIVSRCVTTMDDNGQKSKFFINDRPSTPEDIIKHEISANINTELRNQEFLENKKGRKKD